MISSELDDVIKNSELFNDQEPLTDEIDNELV